MKKLFMSMAALSMLLVACQKDDTNNNKGVEKIKVTANLSQGEKTKVDVDPDGLGVYWTSGDAVSVFGELKTGSSFTGQLTTNITAKSKTALFEGSVNETMDNNYYILYPYDNLHESSDGTSINLNLIEQTCPNSDDLTYLGQYMYMVSKNPGQKGNDDIMEFGMEHLTTLIQFSVFLQEPREGLELYEVIISGNNIRSECNLNVYDKSVNYTSASVIHLNISTPIALSTMEKTFFVPMFPNTEEGEINIELSIMDNISREPIKVNIPAYIYKTEAGKRYTKILPVMIE